MNEWTIWKGWHESLSNICKRLLPRIGTKPVTYTFLFTKENWFPYKDSDDLDINKLAGYSYLNHHKNSVRIGWTPMFNREGYYTLYFYLYNNGQRIMTRFADIAPGTEYSIKISLKDDNVIFDLIEKNELIHSAKEKFIIPKWKIGYYLWFYFGGNKPAPKKMSVFLKK